MDDFVARLMILNRVNAAKSTNPKLPINIKNNMSTNAVNPNPVTSRLPPDQIPSKNLINNEMDAMIIAIANGPNQIENSKMNHVSIAVVGKLDAAHIDIAKNDTNSTKPIL